MLFHTVWLRDNENRLSRCDRCLRTRPNRRTQGRLGTTRRRKSCDCRPPAPVGVLAMLVTTLVIGGVAKELRSGMAS